MSGSSLAIDISRVRDGAREVRADRVAVEEPLEIQLSYQGPQGAAAKSLSITMRTPGHDADLALGFLYSESIVREAADVASVAHVGPDSDEGYRNVVRVELAAGVPVDLERLTRHFYTTSSCGVCGKTSMDALRAVGAASLGGIATRFSREVLAGMPQRLRDTQAVFEATGGLHAAAAFTSQGEIVLAREDVGRHNAVDKVVGALLAGDRLPAAELGLMVSGRASFELMQKTLVAGMPLLAAVSAPSSLAVKLAAEFGMTLVGFLRGPQFNIYAGAERIV
ncbi:MAG TPA: formate dehydrogenase accessory sulfurtransferase FdhD [Woeseiaceae bacterium]|nr:formate dehydrogenase accessory sulfurtransferase FdhD [Woeseiaceae bacterium]